MNSPSRALIAAAALLAVALFVFGSALVRAIIVEPVLAADADTHASPVQAVADSHREEPLGMDELLAALDNDPFQPDRRRAPVRYRLPGDVDPPPPPPPPAPPPVPDFRVAGTAVAPEGGFAVMRIGEGQTRVLAVGEYMAGYRLERVSAGSVIMKNDAHEVTVSVPGPSASVAAARPAAPPGRAPAPAQRPQQSREMSVEQAAMLNALLERARAQGATPQMLQALQRMIQERGLDAMGGMDIQIQGGGMSISPRRPDTTSVPLQPPAPSRR
jgi:hypothetical protein